MKKNQLFERLRTKIKEYIKDETNKGDWVSIITFGTDVKIIASEEIRSEKTIGDIDSLLNKIDKLKSNEKYTHITKALDILASQMQLTQKANPHNSVQAFLFTDGKNEPPKDAEGADWTFNQILKKHYDIFDNPYTFLYIITLGVKPDEELVNAVKGKKGISIEDHIDRIEPIKIPKPKLKKIVPIEKIKLVEKVKPIVNLGISGKGKLNPGENIKYNLKIKVKEVSDSALNKTLMFKVSIIPDLSITVKNPSLNLRKGITEKIPIVFNNIREGDYKLKINFTAKNGIKIIPNHFTLDIKVKKFNPAPLIILLILIALISGFVIYLKKIPRFTDDHIVINTLENIEYCLKDSQKFYSSSVSSKELEIEDMEFTLKINRKTGEVEAKVMSEGEFQNKILNSGDIILDPYKFEIKMI
jgi:hypothetical protein